MCETVNMTCLSFSTPPGCTDGNVTGSRRLFQAPVSKGRRQERRCAQARGARSRPQADGRAGIFNARLLLVAHTDPQPRITLNGITQKNSLPKHPQRRLEVINVQGGQGISVLKAAVAQTNTSAGNVGGKANVYKSHVLPQT